jgi:hypothetical protein
MPYAVFATAASAALTRKCAAGCYNADSADTGGLVSEDWHDLLWDKLQFLTSRLGLTPYYALT